MPIRRINALLTLSLRAILSLLPLFIVPSWPVYAVGMVGFS